MRKSKRPIRWEEPSADSSKELDAELDDFDEEIIDLEYVIEPHGDGLEEDDELGLDTEILDEGSGLGLGNFESKIESEEDFLFEGDLLKELPFFDNQKAEPEPSQEQDIEDIGEEASAESAPWLFVESDEGVPEEAEIEGEALVAEGTKAEVFALPGEPPAEANDSLDEFIAQIESRLVDAIREIVESRLPEMVRTILKEEIERLKNEEELEA